MDRSNTLPPLRSLNLPRGNVQLPPIHEMLHEQGSQIPSSSLRPHVNVPASTPPTPMRKIRLEHASSLESADAVLLVALPSSPNAPLPQPLFLFGPVLQRLRRGQYPLPFGARVYPYRIIRGPSDRPPIGPTNTNT